jgi:hypothetical protein
VTYALLYTLSNEDITEAFCFEMIHGFFKMLLFKVKILKLIFADSEFFQQKKFLKSKKLTFLQALEYSKLGINSPGTTLAQTNKPLPAFN